MKILLKYIIKNIREKKLRTFLIIFSIMMASALAFSAREASDNMAKITLERMQQSAGDSDIIIINGSDTVQPFFKMNFTEELKQQTDYIIGASNGLGYYKNNTDTYRVNLNGLDLNDMQTLNPIVFKQRIIDHYEGNIIIISQKAADQFHVNLGDKLKLLVNKSNVYFKVVGIANPKGYFIEDGSIFNAIVPKETMGKLNEAKNKVNTVFIKLKNQSDREKVIGKLSKQYDDYVVKAPFTIEEVRQQTGGMTTAFTLVMILVICISIFIIYSSFMVLTTERLPHVGTFRSVGATKKATAFLLVIESLVYGCIGGVLGCGLGIIILYIINSLTMPSWAKQTEPILSFDFKHLIIVFLSAIILAVVSSIIPIIHISKMPLKNIIIQDVSRKITKKRTWVLGVILLILTISSPMIVGEKRAVIANVLSIFFIVASAALLTPFITNCFIIVFRRPYGFIFGNEGTIGIKNVKDNKSILNTIVLLAIGISSLLMINTVSYSVVNGITSVYNDRFDDVMISDSKADKNFQKSLLSVDGVKNLYSLYEEHDIEVVGQGFRIRAIQGADDGKFLDFRRLDMKDANEMLGLLNLGDTILLATMLRDRLNLKEGDSITLKMKKGERAYKIIGFFDTLLFSGNYALLSPKTLREDSGTKYYYRVYLQTSKDPSEVAAVLKKKYIERESVPLVFITKEEENISKETYNQLFDILRAFSFMTLIIGIFGVVNNLIISFIARKRSIAVYRSIGMSKTQNIKVIFIEALTGGIIGGVIGVLLGVELIAIVGKVLRAVGQPITIEYSYRTLAISFIAGVFITIVASISPAMKNSQLNIIESIKYE